MNKSLILVFAFFTVTTSIMAQTSSGNMMLGGGVTFNSVSYENGSANDGSSVTFSPGFGYFISDNLAIGTTFTLSSSRNGTGANKNVNSSFGLGPFARYYLFTSNESFAFFGQAQITFASGKNDPAFGNVSKSNSIALSIFPGAAYFFNEHWAIELAITGFIFSSTDPNTSNDNDKYSGVHLGLNSLTPNLGIRYHF
jgi:outer membrane protein